VKLFIKKGSTDFIGGFRVACKYGRRDVAKWFFEEKLIDIDEILDFIISNE